MITLNNMVPLLRVAGEYERATAAFERARSLYPHDDLFLELGMRSQAVMLCVDSGRPERAAEHLECCRRILAQQEDWLGIAGPVWRAEGIVAALEDRSQESDDHFAKAIENHRQYSLPWDEAETLHYWGRALLRAGQLDRAQERLDAAIKIYRDHGAGQCWIDRVEADRCRADQPSVDPRPRSATASRETAGGEAVFRNEGDFWTIGYLDHSLRLRDMRGLHYIAYLLEHPNERFHVRDLVAIVGGDALSATTAKPRIHPERRDAAPMLDHKAKADYRARLSELRADLDEAERMNDGGHAERIAPGNRVRERRVVLGSWPSRPRSQNVGRGRARAPAYREEDSLRAERNSRARSIARPSLHHLHPHGLLLRLYSRSAPASVVEAVTALLTLRTVQQPR